MIEHWGQYSMLVFGFAALPCHIYPDQHWWYITWTCFFCFFMSVVLMNPCTPWAALLAATQTTCLRCSWRWEVTSTCILAHCFWSLLMTANRPGYLSLIWLHYATCWHTRYWHTAPSSDGYKAKPEAVSCRKHPHRLYWVFCLFPPGPNTKIENDQKRPVMPTASGAAG